MKNRRTGRYARGATIVEFALISPVLMLVGLGLVQVGLVFHGKSALNFALQEAARSGAAGNAGATNIQQGFLRGLIPYIGGASSQADLATSLASATAEFARGSAEGWVRMKQLSPTPQSFADWQENALDDNGNSVVQIPNANLPVLRCTRTPNSGAAGYRTSTACGGSGEPVGANSEQTLADANLLKLQLTYGVRMGIPFINVIVAKALAMMAGCQVPAAQRAGSLNLGTPAVGTADATACAAYNAVDISGNPDPRIPVSISITVRMQSPARSSDSQGWLQVVNRSRDANTSGTSLGNGTVDDASQFAPVPVAQLNPNGVTLSADTQNKTGVGSTEIGDPNQTDTLGSSLPPITCTGH